MASMNIHMLSTKNLNHVAFSETIRPLRSVCTGQVCLPKRAKVATASPTKQTVVVASPVAVEVEARASSGSKTSTTTANSLAHSWREIQGSDNWNNLVDQLHPLLRQEIIRYGDFVNACYCAFDLDPNSKRYLNCKYGKKSMLREVGMESSGYEVTKYIYATPDINIPIQNGESCGRWIGYVALATDEAVKRLGRRDIIISFRGTVTNPEWVANLMSSLTPARLDPYNERPDVKVESGFLSLYTSDESDSRFGLGSCREQLLSEVSRLLKKYKGEELSITLAGHSMGSSLALLLAYDITELGLNRVNWSTKTPVTVFSFGGPRVGNSGFKRRCEELGVKVLRIVNVNDPITKIPGMVFNLENFRVLGSERLSFEFPWSCSCYAHVGVELVLDFFNMKNPSCVHDLGTYISLLKCPRRSSMEIQRDTQGGEFVNKAKELLANMISLQNLNLQLSIPWRSSNTTTESNIYS
ncbi:galactolipase DONGLE, chloroplastic [Argentina anserina]|uniref:galactolipase DONGLE, chloroplastic n=1 Tax=Argentina anserina TaxID=57926 RepID=UPI00217648CF|nr:galactolipase DONGLE, chloroplastic [Potentilla anserina]